MSDKTELIKKQINQAYKKPIIQTFNDYNTLSIERYSSGLLTLDLILGGNKESGYGFPIGRPIELYGPESGGKTTIALSTVATAQKEGKIVAWIDAEHCFDFEYAQKLGVDIEEILVCHPASMEEAFEVAESLTLSKEIDLIVIDSIATLLPKKIIEAGYDENSIGKSPQLITRFINTITPFLYQTKTSLIIINQMREKPGVMYGSPETTPGGRALRHSYSIRLEVRRGEVLKDNGNDFGHMVKCKTKKNKTAPPERNCEVRLDWGIGFNKTSDLVEVARFYGVTRKSGAWIYYGEQKWQGDANFIEELNNNQELYDEISETVLKAI